MMEYQQFVTLCAKYGYIITPLSQSEYEKVIKAGFSPDDAYEIGCDMACNAFGNINNAITFYKGFSK